jgi:hypothetical protein
VTITKHSSFLLAMSLVAACSNGPVAPHVRTPSTFDIHGSVQSAATQKQLVGVTVEIVSGSSAGQTARTDDLGEFRFFAVSGDPMLRVAVPGFETMTRGVNKFGELASASFLLMPLPRILSGRVTETAPTAVVPIAGARVTLRNHFQSGSEQQVITDADGRFSASIVCPCELRVEAEGYDTRERIFHEDYAPVAVQLSAKGRIVVEIIGSVSGPPRPPANFFRSIRFPGRIIVSDFSFPGSPFAPSLRTIEIWEGSRLIAAGSATRSRSMYVEVDVAGGTGYDIRITGGDWFQVKITRPS